MKKFLLTLLLTLSSAVAFAMSGSGTSSSPYLVQTADDLYAIRNNPGAYYKLNNDISLTSWINASYPSQGWVPICSSSAFTGTFDGNGYTISGLYINRTTSYNGLFAQTNGATIKNLHIKCNIYGSDYTGAIAGSGSGTISDCFVEGSVSGGQYTGGLLGYCNDMNLTRCAIEGSISGKSSTGGLIGYYNQNTAGSSTSMYRCYVKGNITSSGNYTGGLIGYEYSLTSGSTWSGLKIDNCYYDGNITSSADYVGGVAGLIMGWVTRCYAKGSVTGKDYVGGIAGLLNDGSRGNSAIYQSVCLCSTIKGTASNADIGRICSITGSYAKLGEFGTTTENKVITSCTLYRASTSISASDSPKNGYATSSAALKRQATYELIGWSFTSSYWGIEEGIGYPYLRWRQPAGTITNSGKEESATFNFTSPTTLSPSVTPSGEEDTGVNVTDKTFRSGDISVAFGLGSRTQSFSARIWTNDNLSKTLRVYQNGTMTISTTDNNLITKITFNGEDISMMSANTGSISGGAWAGSANKVTFTIGASMNKINSITVTYKRDKMPLTDSAPTVLAGTYGSGKISYSRYASGDYASFCFPFDVYLGSATGIEKVYMPMDQILYNTQTEYLMMFLKEQSMSSTIKAGTPFLAKISDANVSFVNTGSVTYNSNVTSNPTAKVLTVFDFDGKSGVLYQNNTLDVTWGGTYVATAATTGLNSFNINGSFGQHSGTLSPYRAYVMQTAKSGANSNVRGIQLNLGDDEGEVTSIFQLLNAPAATESIYDMQGRRVINPQQGGLYIINGKKVRL